MKKSIIGAVIGLSLIASNVFAWNEKIVSIQGKDVDALKIHTTHHQLTGAKNIALIRLSGLEGTCSKGVFFDTTENTGTFSIALAAIASKNEIRITYDLDQATPWGDNKYCALTGIQYEN